MKAGRGGEIQFFEQGFDGGVVLLAGRKASPPEGEPPIDGRIVPPGAPDRRAAAAVRAKAIEVAAEMLQQSADALDVIDGRTTAFARSIAEFKTGEAFWIDLARRPLRTYATDERDFPVPVLQDLERERADYFRQRGDENYANALSLVYQWQPPAGMARLGTPASAA